MWSSSIVVSSFEEVRAVAEASGGGPDDVDQPRRRVRLAPDRQVAVADHVEQDQRLEAGERAGLLRRLHVVAAAVGVVGVAVHSTTASSPSKNSSSIVNSFWRALSTPPELEQRRRRRGAVAGADEAEVANQLGVVVAGEDDPLGAAAGDRGDDVDHRHARRAASSASKACSRAWMPAALSSARMYCRVCASAADPAGRGPKPTWRRRCSQARALSNVESASVGRASAAARRCTAASVGAIDCAARAALQPTAAAPPPCAPSHGRCAAQSHR